MSDALIYAGVFLLGLVAGRFGGLITPRHREAIADRVLIGSTVAVVAVATIAVTLVVRSNRDLPDALPTVVLAVGVGLIVGYLLAYAALRRHEALEDELNEALKDMVIEIEGTDRDDPRVSDGRMHLMTPAQERRLRRAQRRRGRRDVR